jgi:hypothetical protein
VKELADLIAMGRDNRRVGATDANAHSSRSHRFGDWAVRCIQRRLCVRSYVSLLVCVGGAGMHCVTSADSSVPWCPAAS